MSSFSSLPNPPPPFSVIPYNETVAQEVEVKFLENYTAIVAADTTGFSDWVQQQIADFFGVKLFA